jgi:hypothetical protein
VKMQTALVVALITLWMPFLTAIAGPPPPILATGGLTRVDFVEWDEDCGFVKVDGKQQELCYANLGIASHDIWIDLPSQCDGAYNWGVYTETKSKDGSRVYLVLGLDSGRYGGVENWSEIGYGRGTEGTVLFTSLSWWCGIEAEPYSYEGVIDLTQPVQFSWPAYWDWQSQEYSR